MASLRPGPGALREALCPRGRGCILNQVHDNRRRFQKPQDLTGHTDTHGNVPVIQPHVTY